MWGVCGVGEGMCGVGRLCEVCVWCGGGCV